MGYVGMVSLLPRCITDIRDKDATLRAYWCHPGPGWNAPRITRTLPSSNRVGDDRRRNKGEWDFKGPAQYCLFFSSFETAPVDEIVY
jgi:hypothetical protein